MLDRIPIIQVWEEWKSCLLAQTTSFGVFGDFSFWGLFASSVGGPLLGILAALLLDTEWVLVISRFGDRLGILCSGFLLSLVLRTRGISRFVGSVQHVFKSILFGKSLDLDKSCKTMQGCFIQLIFIYIYLPFVSCWSSFLELCVSTWNNFPSAWKKSLQCFLKCSSAVD